MSDVDLLILAMCAFHVALGIGAVLSEDESEDDEEDAP